MKLTAREKVFKKYLLNLQKKENQEFKENVMETIEERFADFMTNEVEFTLTKKLELIDRQKHLEVQVKKEKRKQFYIGAVKIGLWALFSTGALNISTEVLLDKDIINTIVDIVSILI